MAAILNPEQTCNFIELENPNGGSIFLLDADLLSSDQLTNKICMIKQQLELIYPDNNFDIWIPEWDDFHNGPNIKMDHIIATFNCSQSTCKTRETDWLVVCDSKIRKYFMPIPLRKNIEHFASLISQIIKPRIIHSGRQAIMIQCIVMNSNEQIIHVMSEFRLIIDALTDEREIALWLKIFFYLDLFDDETVLIRLGIKFCGECQDLPPYKDLWDLRRNFEVDTHNEMDLYILLLLTRNFTSDIEIMMINKVCDKLTSENHHILDIIKDPSFCDPGWLPDLENLISDILYFAHSTC